MHVLHVLTIGHGQDGAVEHVDGDRLGLGRGRMTGVEAGVAVVNVVNHQPRKGTTSNVLQQEWLLRRLRPVKGHNLQIKSFLALLFFFSFFSQSHFCSSELTVMDFVRRAMAKAWTVANPLI